MTRIKAYVGQTRSASLIGELVDHGIGECVVRGELPPRRPQSWFYDNGAYSDMTRKREFNVNQYARDMRKIAYWSDMPKPDFIVLPDLVAQGAASLEHSRDWIEWTKAAGAPMYLAVQDGMTPETLPEDLLLEVDGLFVGGSLPWKMATAEAWTVFAHARGLKVHIGRVGIASRIEWAIRIGADSIDSSLPLWTDAKMRAFLDAVAPAAALDAVA